MSIETKREYFDSEINRDEEKNKKLFLRFPIF